MIKVGDEGEVSDFMGCGDLRTLLFAGGQGLANSTFSHVGDLFMEHDVQRFARLEGFTRQPITTHNRSAPPKSRPLLNTTTFLI